LSDRPFSCRWLGKDARPKASPFPLSCTVHLPCPSRWAVRGRASACRAHCSVRAPLLPYNDQSVESKRFSERPGCVSIHLSLFTLRSARTARPNSGARPKSQRGWHCQAAVNRTMDPSQGRARVVQVVAPMRKDQSESTRQWVSVAETLSLSGWRPIARSYRCDSRPTPRPARKRPLLGRPDQRRSSQTDQHLACVRRVCMHRSLGKVRVPSGSTGNLPAMPARSFARAG